MQVKLNKTAALLALALSLTGCGDDRGKHAADAPGRAPVQAAITDPHALAQMELEKVALDLHRFVAVRIEAGDRRLEASPLAPAVVADARLGSESVKTLFRVNPTGDKLILFSRDVFNARSLRTEIGLKELEQQKVFTFPVVQPDGSVKPEDFKLIEIIRPE